MTKYAPLKDFLSETGAPEIPMRFSEIEKVIHGTLPPTAFKHRAWWSNNASNSVVTRAWLEAGYRTERVDLEARRLVFRRAIGPHSTETAKTVPRREGRHPLFGALKGAVSIPAGVDLTEPADPDWGRMYDD